MYPEELIRRRRTAPRQPMDERIPDGRTVMDLLAGTPELANPSATRPRVVAAYPPGEPPPMTLSLPMPPAPGGPVTPTPVPPVRLGNPVSAGATNLERLMAQHATLAQADPSSKVKRTDWGYETMPPEQSPSRVRHAGMGAVQGAIMAGQASKGDPWATLAGTAVGALTGGVSPALIQAFNRRLEQDQVAGDLATEQKLQLQNAQIGETVAQAEQRRMEPYLKAEELRAQNERFEATEAGRNRRADASNRTRVQTATEANKHRQSTLEETIRHNRAMENRPGAATEEITVGGRKFRVSANTAARILEERTKASTKPDKAEQDRYEASLEDALETEAANDHLGKRREAEESASALRAERDKLAAGVGAKRNESRIKELDRQIAQAEKEATYRQKEADDAFMRARKAKAKAGGTSGRRTIEGAVEEFRRTQKREPTPEEIERMRKALNR